MSAKLFFAQEGLKKNERRTSNMERWMRKDEETEFKKPELFDNILQETEELIKIFVTSIKRPEKKQK